MDGWDEMEREGCMVGIVVDCVCVCVENQGGAPANACLPSVRPYIQHRPAPGIQRSGGPTDQTPEPGIEHPRPSREIGCSLSSDRVQYSTEHSGLF